MNGVVRVIPDVPTMAVDDGFLYAAPDPIPTVGAAVRVPLGGRTVRGFVVATGGGSTDGLKAIKSVSPALPLFDEVHLGLFRWLSRHYVAPFSSILRTARPTNLPRSTRAVPEHQRGPGGRVHLLGGDQVGLVRSVLTELPESASALVVCPTEVEAQALVAEGLGREVTTVLPSSTGAEVTKAWVRARTRPGTVVVGTPRIAAWPVARLHTAVLVDDGRRGHKSRQTPTIHARTLLGQRTRLEGVRLVTTGVVPTLEAAGSGTEIRHPGSGRLWSRVEVVDRTEDPPGTGIIGRRADVAIAGAAKAGVPIAVFSHRRGYAPAFRCTKCLALRTCPACSSRATMTAACGRCGARLGPCADCGSASFEPLGAAVGVVADRLRRIVDPSLVGLGPGHPVSVVAGRDLPGLDPVGLAVAVDADGLLLGPSFRSAEDGLRLLARLATKVERGSGHRLMVQTGRPDHPAIEALRRGDPREWIPEALAERELLGFPPAGDLIVIEARGGKDIGNPFQELDASGVMVLGPTVLEDRSRWLIQGPDLGPVRDQLRAVARRLRDGGTEVRVDVDPIDL